MVVAVSCSGLVGVRHLTQESLGKSAKKTKTEIMISTFRLETKEYFHQKKKKLEKNKIRFPVSHLKGRPPYLITFRGIFRGKGVCALLSKSEGLRRLKYLLEGCARL